MISTVTTSETLVNAKAPGTISVFFDSLSGKDKPSPLPQRFADLKRKLIPNKAAETQLQSGWNRLLVELERNNPIWASKGPWNIPQITPHELLMGDNTTPSARSVLEAGTVVVKGVVNREQALEWKENIRKYVKTNPDTKGFPEHDPQVFDLFWTPSQIEARTHPRMVELVTRMNQLWNASPDTKVSLNNPIFYADRCRERHPGDTSFSLGPHADSGTIERWEDETYSSVYTNIISKWEDWDPWNVDSRVEANTDLYDSPGGSSVFRTFQGWLSLSSTGPGEGTLRVHPSIKHATAYFWMRPFFEPVRDRDACETKAEYLAAKNWKLNLDSTSFPGSPPGRGQEFSDETHPHLELGITMTSIPKVEPGDCVFWHCDGIHAVESKHDGKGDSSVIYIGAAPLTKSNAEYVIRQKEAFIYGAPPPDFPGGVGERQFDGRAKEKDLKSDAARAGMGFAGFKVDGKHYTEGELEVLRLANELYASSIELAA